MANAMARGKATTPTMTPAMASARNCWRVHPFNVVNNVGSKTGMA